MGHKSKKDKSEKDNSNNPELRVKLDDLKDIGTLPHYKGKPFTGIAETYYDSGKLKEEYNYKNGKEEGIVKMYYESGQLEFEGNFKNGTQEGISKSYYESGQLQTEGNLKNAKREGFYKNYHPNGKLHKEHNYKNDKLEDIGKTYHSNGKLYIESNWKNGTQEGIVKSYDESGQLQTEGNLKNAKREGFYKKYHPNGKLHKEHNYKNGKLEGITKLYYESGELQAEQNFKNGNMEINKNTIVSSICGFKSDITLELLLKNIEEIIYNKSRDSWYPNNIVDALNNIEEVIQDLKDIYTGVSDECFRELTEYEWELKVWDDEIHFNYISSDWPDGIISLLEKIFKEKYLMMEASSFYFESPASEFTYTEVFIDGNEDFSLHIVFKGRGIGDESNLTGKERKEYEGYVNNADIGHRYTYEYYFIKKSVFNEKKWWLGWNGPFE